MVYIKLGPQQKLSRILQRWIVKENRRYASGGGGVTGLISKAFTLTVIGAAGVAAYAYYDPAFRQKVNKTCPQAKPILDAILPKTKEESETSMKKGARNLPAPIFMTSESDDEYEMVPKPVQRLKQYNKQEIAKIAEEVFDQKYKQPAASTEDSYTTKISKTSFDEELKEALQRQSEEHSKHEEEILRLQRESMFEQHKKDIQEALVEERQEYNKHLTNTINKLDSLEAFLNARSEFDEQNRKAKKLWIVSQRLKTTLSKGKDDCEIKTYRINLAKEIDALKVAAADDEFVHQLITLVPEKALTVGVCPEYELAERFRKVKNLCRATARIGDDGGNLFQYFLSYLQSKFYWDTFKETTDFTEVDVNASTYDILSRVSYCLDQKDYDSVVRLMSLLKGEPSNLSSDWVNDTRLFLETRQWADILIAHASALSVRTLY